MGTKKGQERPGEGKRPQHMLDCRGRGGQMEEPLPAPD